MESPAPSQMPVMIEDVAAAIERKDYKTATRLLKPLLQQMPKDPWVRLYLGEIQEVSGKPESAEQIYRRLLQGVDNPKIVLQARRGLARLEATARENRQEAIAKATQDPTNAGTGLLLIKPIQGDARKSAAQNFARIMHIDPYTAQMQLPSRGWRLYRVGKLAEIQVYGQDLQQNGIPVFWTALSDLKAISVFRVDHIRSLDSQLTVVCHNEAGQLGTLSLMWPEISQAVKGALPIFENVVDLDAFKRLKRKEQTQDYAQLYDLHLHGRQCILRFCDRTYQFQQGVTPNAGESHPPTPSQSSNRLKWNQLLSIFGQHLGDRPVNSDFAPFAETAIDLLDLVESFETHIDIFRTNKSNWDPAFHLYSGLSFLMAR